MLPVRDSLPTRLRPAVNYALIALNIGVFAIEAALAMGGADMEALSRQWALVPAQLLAHPLASAPTLLIHMFLHGGLAHVAGNMLFLWIFGDNVEDALGHARYVFFYLVCGLVAAFAQVAMSPQSTEPMLGASGAISGVLAAYLILYPTSPITVVNPIPFMWLFWGLFILLPAWFVIIEWFAVNLWNALQPSNAAGGVAFVAHVGGFVGGLALSPLLRTRKPVEYDPWQRMLGPRRSGLSS
jgi:membrane associated rhomboid family serine protease